MEGRVVLRRGVTLADQLAAVSPPAPAASCNLRDLLKLRDDDDLAAAAGVTLNSAMAAEKRASSSSSSGGRTLLDIIRDEQPSSSAGGVPVVPRAASSPVPDATAASASTAGGPAGETSQRGQRVSLMALLERTERRWCGDGGGERGREEDAASEACDEEAGKKGVGGRCCVCMVRAKGAAFIPCGHTFCRACARELSAGRGRCPLCNAAIHQVLDIF